MEVGRIDKAITLFKLVANTIFYTICSVEHSTTRR